MATEGVVKIGFVFRSSIFAKNYRSDKKLLCDIIKHVKGSVTVEILDLAKININIGSITKSFDLICSMSRDPRIIQILPVYQARGVKVINSTDSLCKVLNKGLTYTLLANNGISIPDTHIVGNLMMSTKYPFILKNLRHDSKSLRNNISINSIENLPATYETPAIIQEPIVSPDYHVKCYAIGQKIFIKNLHSLRQEDFGNCYWSCSYDVKVLKEISLRIGEILGLEVYNIEVLKANGQCFVIDVNDFPSFEGVPEASQEIVKYIIEILSNHK